MAFGSFPQDVDVHDQVADLLLQLLDLLLPQFFFVLGTGSRRVLCGEWETSFPVLYLRYNDTVLLSGLMEAVLPFEDTQCQG